MKTKEVNRSECHGRIKPDLILGMCLVVLASIFIFYLVPQYITEPQMVKNPMLSPRFLPLVTGWVVLLLSVIVLLEGIRRPPKQNSVENVHAKVPRLRWVLMLAAGLVYSLLLEELGAIASGVIATAMLFIAHGLRQVRIYLLALVFPVVVSLLFVHVLNVPLPVGMIWE
uniref:tripartite tricarboxylate transporter TctB family protein n=1 Tax=Marinobacterium profundum TaxID=1714300 RepID=UPI0008312831|nr:tripartite tricarboxylate transporter TctB family protein [Marinobacterium profundum]